MATKLVVVEERDARAVVAAAIMVAAQYMEGVKAGVILARLLRVLRAGNEPMSHTRVAS